MIIINRLISTINNVLKMAALNLLWVHDEDFSSMQIGQNVTVGEQEILLRNLTPHTVYTASIRCIPVIEEVPKGFWSEPKSQIFQTSEDGMYMHHCQPSALVSCTSNLFTPPVCGLTRLNTLDHLSTLL